MLAYISEQRITVDFSRPRLHTRALQAARHSRSLSLLPHRSSATAAMSSSEEDYSSDELELDDEVCAHAWRGRPSKGTLGSRWRFSTAVVKA